MSVCEWHAHSHSRAHSHTLTHTHALTHTHSDTHTHTRARARTHRWLNKLFISGRHQQVSCICSVQSLALVSTTIRKNLTCALFFKATAKEAQFIEDEYRPSEIARDDFRQIFEECPKEKYSFLMMDFRSVLEKIRISDKA